MEKIHRTDCAFFASIGRRKIILKYYCMCPGKKEVVIISCGRKCRFYKKEG